MGHVAGFTFNPGWADLLSQSQHKAPKRQQSPLANVFDLSGVGLYKLAPLRPSLALQSETDVDFPAIAQLRTREMPSNHVEAALTNGLHDDHSHSHHSPPLPKKASKVKKSAKSSDEASRLLYARINQLEQDAAGEKDQELEIGRCRHVGLG